MEWQIVAQENQIQCNGMFEDSSIEFGNCHYQYHFIGKPQSRSNQDLVLSSEEITGVTQRSCLQKQLWRMIINLMKGLGQKCPN